MLNLYFHVTMAETLVLLSGVATNLWQVVLGRALSGTGGAGMAAMVAFTIAGMWKMK